ncbi:hypothetical protein CCMSSC00406_0003261 [Pleurotus cornucopiae]|uniref:Uncharacterized protein n=1 Tax=Pleurotus cornucopiae TaxID=5321 RepID=A0ACB7J798_PLECO|nr:hypothetical protein CCMSSC00406_0003261 [Pleurotus cornucopiae]
MRSSQALFRRSRSLFQSSTALNSARRSTTRLARPSRKDVTVPSSTGTPGVRLSSSATPPPSNEPVEPIPESTPTPTPPPDAPENEGAPSEDSEKPRVRRTRLTLTVSKDAETLQLPEDLDILWAPESEPPERATSDLSVLPPDDIFDDALHNLHIALHPQTQHKATYATGSAATEPTLALCCPIEGGEYIIDATVRELGRRTGAEVIELDAVQLAAGEWGHFGKAGSAIQLPQNPLHFASSSSSSTPTSRSNHNDEDDDQDMPAQMFPPQQMTLTLMTSASPSGRTVISPPSRRTSTPSKAKIFFDALVNTPPKQNTDDPQPSSSTSSQRPRLIYVRDFQTLAATSSTWYPPLLSAVRQRRRGPISRPSSPVSNPMVIVFGISPSLTPPSSLSPQGAAGFVNLLMNRSPQSDPSIPRPRPTKVDWTEDPAAEKARERRLRDRMRRWEQGEASLQFEIPKLASGSNESEGNSKPDVVVIGGPRNLPFLPPFLRGASTENADESDESDAFFRTSVVFPRKRSPSDERNSRMARRREINELTMRMAVGGVGGILDKEVTFAGEEEDTSAVTSAPDEQQQPQIWADWGQRIEPWSNVRSIADRAVGSAMGPSHIGDKPTLEPTPISWDVVRGAWLSHHSGRKLRKTWSKELMSVTRTQREDEDQDDDNTEPEPVVDEVVERVKADPELEPHEQRLLSSIVDSTTMPTSFSQVHLPPHTIDSVRTIVSLPLLYPAAFQQGILKDHAMTGCLLFGPPGTGKTLVVRALAKEAGCRMMVISPSDVMDMYVGEGEKLVKGVFSLARKLSPCVVFLDEIDALFGARMSARESGGAFAHRGVITEFMQEMDGLKTSKENSVIVIGATNRPFDLDDAILRRLPRRLLVDLPGEKEREEILKILLRDESLAEDVSPNDLAKKTESFSGSDLKHLCVSAALDAVKECVDVPWAPSKVTPTETKAPEATPPEIIVEELASTASDVKAPSEAPSTPPRVLHLRNFEKALKEITPSSSESLGTLTDLRKWNDEFGEGRKDRKRVHVWGKGRFGFINQDTNVGDGRVSSPAASSQVQTLETRSNEHQ